MAGVSRTAAARSRSAVAWVARGPASIHLEMLASRRVTFSGQRLAVGLQGAHAVLDGRDNGRQRRDAVLHGAHRAGGPAQVAGVERHVGRQQAQLGDVVGQGAAVLVGLAGVAAGQDVLHPEPGVAHGLSSSSVSAGARPRGSTTLWTSVAQTMPSAISSTRASAVSNTSVGSETDETDHGGGVAGQHEQIGRGVRSSTDIYRQAPTHRAMAAVITTGELDRRGTM